MDTVWDKNNDLGGYGEGDIIMLSEKFYLGEKKRKARVFVSMLADTDEWQSNCLRISCGNIHTCKVFQGSYHINHYLKTSKATIDF